MTVAVPNGTSVIARPVEGLGEVVALSPLLSGVLLLLPTSSEIVLSSVLPVSAGWIGSAVVAVVSVGSFGSAVVAVVSVGSLGSAEEVVVSVGSFGFSGGTSLSVELLVSAGLSSLVGCEK